MAKDEHHVDSTHFELNLFYFLNECISICIVFVTIVLYAQHTQH